LEELLLELSLELLELLESLLPDSEPGIGGAEPGKGCSSAAGGRWPEGAGASGVDEEEPGSGGAGASPGKGNRSDVEGSLVSGAVQGVGLGLLAFFFGADPSSPAVVCGQGGGAAEEFCVCRAGAAPGIAARATVTIKRMKNRLTIFSLDYSFRLRAARHNGFDSHKR
jgi:hypothetical protein